MLILCQWTTAEESSNYRRVHVRPGRHVCLSETVQSRPIPVRETYKKAVYTPRRRNCSHLTSCPQYDVTYVTATKTAYHQQKSGSFKYDCCPGWTTQEQGKKGCMHPVCNSGCGELGRCVQPGVCECPRGFQGQNCDTDIDECRLNNHGCHQFCVNTAGSYLCACQDGFSLAEDGKTCIYCYRCSKEYIAMQEELRQMRQELKESQMTCGAVQLRTESLEYKVNHIKTPNLQVQYNLAQLEIKVDELINSVEHFQNTPSSTTSTTSSVSLKTSKESNEIKDSSATSSATENVTFVSQPSTSTPKDLTSQSNPKLSQNATESSMPFATKVLAAGLTSQFPAKEESSESESLSETTRLPSKAMDDQHLAKTTPKEPPYEPIKNISTKLPSEVSTVKTVSSDDLILPEVFKDSSTGTSPTLASTFPSRDQSPQDTRLPVTSKTSTSSSVATASALPSRDLSSPTTRLPATTKTTSSSSAPKQGPQYLPLFLYDRFASLSEQIGILEERIGWCACREPPPY